MKRSWNLSIWLGFLLVVTAIVTYVLVFIQLPWTRDFPWATLLIFGAGLALTARGMMRAFREPEAYRGKIAGPILLGLGVALLGFFCFNVFYFLRQLPDSAGAPRVGDKAPEFTLPDADGNAISLSKLLEPGAGGADRRNGVVLVFYRGYW